MLIADQYNNRVIEVTRQGEIVWGFGDGKSVPGPHSVVAPNDVERLPNGQTLIAGSGAVQGAEPTCNAGCPDNRVIVVDDNTGEIVWQYGEDDGVSGAGPNQLDTPVAAILVPGTGGDHILITDQNNNRIIEVTYDTKKQIVWQFPPVTSPGDASIADAGGAGVEEEAGSGQTLNSPNSAERLTNGDTLIADESNNRAIEIANDGRIVWQYPKVLDTTLLNAATFASRLTNGHTLIADANNNRIIEVVDSTLQVFWQYSTANRNVNILSPNPSCAVRLQDGNTLITDQLNDQVIEVTPAKEIVFTYGQLGKPGNGNGYLNTPYHAVDIGDYTGRTPPTL